MTDYVTVAIALVEVAMNEPAVVLVRTMGLSDYNVLLTASTLDADQVDISGVRMILSKASDPGLPCQIDNALVIRWEDWPFRPTTAKPMDDAEADWPTAGV